jgi:hypothetical protein
MIARVAGLRLVMLAGDHGIRLLQGTLATASTPEAAECLLRGIRDSEFELFGLGRLW